MISIFFDNLSSDIKELIFKNIKITLHYNFSWDEKMETDEKRREIFAFYEEDREFNKENWDEYIRAYKPEVGILSLLMLLNDIFLNSKIQSLVTLFLTEKYKNVIVLNYIF